MSILTTLYKRRLVSENGDNKFVSAKESSRAFRNEQESLEDDRDSVKSYEVHSVMNHSVNPQDIVLILAVCWQSDSHG